MREAHTVDRNAPLRGGSTALLLLALILRVWDFGNPVIHVDEQYYLLVGDRMLQGDVPYLDIWDRKPIGLFLLFAAFRLLPGDGILAYQLLACLSAAATALVVRSAARMIGARDAGAVAAGAIYLIAASLLGGRGGQAPIFYNLLIAAAAWLTIALPGRLARGRSVVASGLWACLLAGIAIQMKYTPVFEGAFFGLAHLWGARRGGMGWLRIAAAALLWIAAGLLPTLAAAAWYAEHGAFETWWFANFSSIVLRPGYPADQLAMRLLGIGAQLSPLILCAGIAWRATPPSAASRLAYGWLTAASVGFVAIGTFFDHYALPLLAPLAVAAAPTLGRSARALVATLGLGATLFIVEAAFRPHDAPGARRVAAVVAANRHGRCPWVFIGDTITYHLAGTCVPTSRAFPNMLAYATERGATGIDETREVARILAARPPLIVSSSRRLSIWNGTSLFAVKTALARDYRPVFSTPRSDWRTVVYLRRDLKYVPPPGR